MKKTLACVVVGLALAGCETMSPQECKVANWYDIGMRDGAAGKTLSILDDRAKDCSKAGEQVNSAQYLQGRERGLMDYCRIENAVSLGLNGTTDQGVCPNPEFGRRVQAGYAVHQARNRVNELDRRSERLQRQLREADRDEEKQLKGVEKDDDRKRIRKDFDERRRQIRNEQRDTDRDTQRARDDLRHVESILDSMR